MNNDRLKRGDVVRTKSGISGEITDFAQTGRIDFVVIRPSGEKRTRKILLDSVTLIPHCENSAIEYDLTATPTNTGFGDRYPVKQLHPCRNRPEVQTGRGTWLCHSCLDRNPPNTGLEVTS